MRKTDEKVGAYLWYPRDFAADEHVVLMTIEQEGAYRRLLDHQWLHGSIPADVAALAALCKKIPRGRMKKIWSAVAPCFMSVEGDHSRLVNAKLERIRQEAQDYRDGQRRAGRLGGLKTQAALKQASSGAQAAVKLASPAASPSPGTTPLPPSTAALMARLVARLAGHPDRFAITEFLETKLPAGSEMGTWIGTVSGCLDGDGLPKQRPAAIVDLAQACRDYPAVAKGAWNPAHFRRCVSRAFEDRTRQPVDAAGVRLPRGSFTERQVAAAKAFAEGGA